jgi:glycosyltransferase involved in cell wall biosynthesis
LSLDPKHPKITVVTPNYNQGNYLERTILSVLNQKYPNLEYIIIDGGSTDVSVAIIKKYQELLHYWVSEKDQGMYDALNKGFKKSSGTIMCWINSDDVLWEGSLEYVAEVFARNSNIYWLQGYPSVINEVGDLYFQRPPVHKAEFFYLKKYEQDFTFIQQESTFWSRSLWNKAGGLLDESYDLAADFDLWMRFFKYEKLYCSKCQLGAFRKREGQRSSDIDKYLAEAKISIEKSWKQLNWKYKLKLKWLKFLNVDVTSKTKYID